NYNLPTTASGAGTINAKTLTAAIIGNPTKVYDATTTVALTPGNYSLTGLVGSASFTVTKTTGAFNIKDVPTANNVTASWVAGDFTPAAGTPAGNYNLPTTASGAGTITPKALTQSGLTVPASKVYDATRNATVSGVPILQTGEPPT